MDTDIDTRAGRVNPAEKETEMIKMSFWDRTYNKEKAVELIRNTDKQIKYTHGLGYRNPTIHNKPISKDCALEILDTESTIDIDEYQEHIHINTYSSNDLW